jgi:hypothetical protein
VRAPPLTIALGLLVLACAGEAPPAGVMASIALPGGEQGIGFDDLQWSQELGRLIVPAGRTGAVDLVDPVSGDVLQVLGFADRAGRSVGHADGCTSAVYGASGSTGWLFAIDRSSQELVVADAVKLAIVARAPLAAKPDYVRWVGGARELWVTEPGAEQIEVFRLPEHGVPQPEPVTRIAVPGGPESLVIDATRARAYTHLWTGTTVVLDLGRHAVVASWSNGCEGSRGIALDEERGWLFVGCAEGRATALDVAHEGRVLGSAATGEGVDIISYDAARRHLYVPAADGTLTLLDVANDGSLAVLRTVPVAAGAQGVVTDGHGRIFVGDPGAGKLLVVRDEAPPR